jgi:hypothetical protein
MPRAAIAERKVEPDLATPQREAAMFYGLFLRGHSAEMLRKAIDIPRRVFEKWQRARYFEPSFRVSLRRVYQPRKMVLAFFNELVLTERVRSRVQ